jgi:hypothetical protein
VARPKKEKQKREAPIQFRPGSELGHLVQTFGSCHNLTMPEACRLLISLAVAEMDGRFAGLVLPLAQAMGGENSYVKACEHVRTALQAARRAKGTSMQTDPERAQFIEETVKVALMERGAGDRFRPLEFIRVGPGAEGGGPPRVTSQEEPADEQVAGTPTRSAEKKKRTFRPRLAREDPEPPQVASQEEPAEEAQPEWSAFPQEEGEHPRVRT